MYDGVYVSNRDNSSADRCHKDLRSMVSYFMRQTGLCREDIEDCTQDCLLQFLEQFGTIVALAQAMQEKRNWILLCTKHKVFNYCRKCQRRMECLDGMDIPLDCIGLERSQEAIVLCQELTERIRICLQKLQPEQHDILARHYLHDETCAGIAATLGIATNALEQRLLRSRRKLYKLFTANGISVAEVSDYFSATTPPVLPHIVR